MDFKQRRAAGATLAVAASIAAAMAIGAVFTLLRGGSERLTITPFEQAKQNAPQVKAQPGTGQFLSERELIDKAVRDERQRQALETLDRRGKDAALAGDDQRPR